jgi:16S rRNA processing protein RimM
VPGTVHVAKIVATRGNRGEVAAICSGGSPERLLALEEVLLGSSGAAMEKIGLAENWTHKGRWILRFPEIESISAAEAYVGRDIFLNEVDLPRLPEGRYYTFALVGATVVHAQGRVLGRVKDTESGLAHDFLLVECSDGREVMVPMTPSIVVSVDVEAGQVIVDPPEGLLEGEPEVVE